MAVRVARVKAGLHQAAVAKRMGVHPTAVSQLERGERAELPDETTILMLDEFLKANGEVAAAGGIQLSADKRRKPRKTIQVDVTDLTSAQVRELQRFVDIAAKGYLVK